MLIHLCLFFERRGFKWNGRYLKWWRKALRKDNIWVDAGKIRNCVMHISRGGTIWKRIQAEIAESAEALRQKLVWRIQRTEEVKKAACEPVTSVMSWLSAAPWTTTHQASLTMRFSRQKYWTGLSCPPPGGLHDRDQMKSRHLLHWQTGSLPLAPPGKQAGAEYIENSKWKKKNRITDWINNC